jgi:hypothetical protein
MNSSFFIVVDRGNLKAYRAEKPSGDRPPRMATVQALSFADAHLSPGQKNTDGAGSFPASGSSSRQNGHGQATSTGEKHYDLEETRRSAKQLGAQINEILGREQPGTWSFAAPADLQDIVLAAVEPRHLKQLSERVPRDLVNIPAQQLLDHFSAVRAVPAA